MTWLDLYNFLYRQANETANFGKFDWQAPVGIHHESTGDWGLLKEVSGDQREGWWLQTEGEK